MNEAVSPMVAILDRLNLAKLWGNFLDLGFVRRMFSITSRHGFSREQLEGIEEGMIQALRRLDRRQSSFLKGLSPELFRMIVRSFQVGNIAEDLRNIDEGKVRKFAGLQRLEEKLDRAVFARIVSDRNVSEEDCEYLSRFLANYRGTKLSEVKIRKLFRLDVQAKGFFISLSDRKREVIMREFVNEEAGMDLATNIHVLMGFLLDYVAALEDGLFAETCVRIVRVMDDVRDFLVGLNSADKFKVIVENEQLFRKIDKIMLLFPAEYFIALEDKDFAWTLKRIEILGTSEDRRTFLLRLKSVGKFKVIVENGQLFRKIDKIIEFSVDHIATLTDDQFKTACDEMAEIRTKVVKRNWSFYPLL